MKKTLAVSSVVLFLFAAAHAEAPYPLAWSHQFGDSGFDRAYRVSPDNLGNVCVVGYTDGDLWGPNAGWGDGFLCKYDVDGNVLWAHQMGGAESDNALGVSADTSGNIYVSGLTNSSLDGPSAGGIDAFVRKYDPAGNVLWTRQIGTDRNDRSLACSVDATGNVFILGDTYGDLGGANAGNVDGFVSKFNAAGDLLWTRQYGTDLEDRAFDISTDSLGNVYVSGLTKGDLAGPNAGEHTYDPYVSKYDVAGNLVWARQFGSEDTDGCYGIDADPTGVYIAGQTYGDLAGPNQGDLDAFVGRYDDAGDPVWMEQFGTTASESALCVVADGEGGLFIGGNITELDGSGTDALLRRLDTSGQLIWEHRLGSDENDGVEGLCLDGFGGVYVSGLTEGSLGGPSAGGWDGYVVKYQVPEPSTLALLGLGALGLLRRR